MLLTGGWTDSPACPFSIWQSDFYLFFRLLCFPTSLFPWASNVKSALRYVEQRVLGFSNYPDKPARICQSQSKKLQISRRQCCLTIVIIMSKTTSTTVDQKTYIPFWWTGSPVSRADLLLENVSPWQAWSTCIFTTTGEGAGEVALSSNVTFLLGEQLETLVYASVKTAERAARESRWGVRIWAEMIKSLLSDLHIEEVDVGTVPNILLYRVIQKEC